jgi:hypothetical protein
LSSGILITSKAEDCCTQFPIVSDATQTVSLTSSGIKLEASASLFGEPARTIMLGGEFQIAPLNLKVIFVDMLDAKIRNGNPA